MSGFTGVRSKEIAYVILLPIFEAVKLPVSPSHAAMFHPNLVLALFCSFCTFPPSSLSLSLFRPNLPHPFISLSLLVRSHQTGWTAVVSRCLDKINNADSITSIAHTCSPVDDRECAMPTTSTTTTTDGATKEGKPKRLASASSTV